jgi:hypothetical protein
MATPVQPTPTQPLEFKDFSGGMTDFYLGGPLNKFERGDNVLIVKHGDIGKLFTRPGSEIYNASYYQIPAGAQRIGTLKYFESVLWYHSSRKFYYVDSGWQTLQGPSGNDVFPTGVDTTTVVSLTTWNKHLLVTSSDLVQKVQKIYKDSGGTWRLRTAGMPALATSPTATPDSAGAVALSYLYRFLYKYTYTVGTVTHVDRGPTTEVTATDAAGSEIAVGTPCAVASIPVLANGTTHNYDTASASLKVEIYRTTNNGQNFFFVGEVSNGTTTYSDTTTDATLLTREPLYTEGGVPENNEPPYCKLVHAVDTRTFYANVKVGSEVLGNRVYQSIPDDADSVPSDFFVELDDDVAGLSSVQSNPVALCLNGSIYRIDGALDEAGGGFLIPQKISSTAGCISSAGVVQTLEGIFWPGIDGFYFSDGFDVIRISTGIRKTYQEFISTAAQKRRIVGVYDKKEKRVYWTVQWTSGATECDAVFVLDLNFGVSDDMPFTTWSGTSFAPTALEFIGENLIRADKRGYTFIHRDTLYVDPKVDTGVVPSSWVSETIIYDYYSVATDFGSSYARKWVSNVSVVCKNETNLALQIYSINDDGRRTGALKPIRFRGNVTWGDPDVYWGDPDLIWNYQGLVDETRRMPAMSLRCEYKQLRFTNAKVAIINSDLLGTATVSNAANTATLDDTATYDWPTGAVDYVLAFATDDYTKEYTVTARTNDALTFADADNTAPIGSVAWVLRGYPKGEVLHLLSYTVEYAIFGQTQSTFKNAGTGEVGAAD